MVRASDESRALKFKLTHYQSRRLALYRRCSEGPQSALLRHSCRAPSVRFSLMVAIFGTAHDMDEVRPVRLRLISVLHLRPSAITKK